MKNALMTIIVPSVLGGVVASVISGYFIRYNNDQMWRSTHLSKDKDALREIINNINKDYLTNLSDQHFNFCQTDKLFEEVERLYLYLDFRNKYAQELYCEYKKVYETMTKIKIEYEEVLDSHSDDDLDFNEYPEFMKLVTERKKNVEDLKELILKYFSTYYPKRNFWLSICKKNSLFW